MNDIHRKALEHTLSDFLAIAEERLKAAGLSWEKLESQYPPGTGEAVGLPAIVTEARRFLLAVEQLRLICERGDSYRAAGEALTLAIELQAFAGSYFDSFAQRRMATAGSNKNQEEAVQRYATAMKKARQLANVHPDWTPAKVARAVIDMTEGTKPAHRELTALLAGEYPDRPRRNRKKA